MYLYELFEGKYDPYINKAIFLVGGPGSGKSRMATELLSGYGLKTVNSDIMFEYLLKKQNLPTTPDVIGSEQGAKIRKRAKELTNKQRDLYIQGNLGLIIDGTGRRFEKIAKIKEILESFGYDTAMIFVNTNLPVALKRNKKRERTLNSKLVRNIWQETQNNIEKYKQIFNDNFFIIDNSEDINSESSKNQIDILSKRIRNFLNE